MVAAARPRTVSTWVTFNIRLPAILPCSGSLDYS